MGRSSVGSSKGKGKGKAAPGGGGVSGAVRALWVSAAHVGFGSRERASRSVSVLLVVAAVVGWFTGKDALIDRSRVARHNALQVTFNWPDLLAHDDSALERQWLAQKVFATVSVDPFDQASLESARVALMKTGWFREIHSIRRGPAGGSEGAGGEGLATVAVEGEWRRPEALVVQDGRKYLVDRDGYVIERPAQSLLGEWAYHIVEPPGVSRGAGQAWSHEAVAQAVRVLAQVDPLIDRARYGQQIRGVDFTGGAGPGTIVLMTDTGSRIVWGSPVGEEVAVTEPVAEEKLGRMAQVLRDYGRVDANAPMLDLRRSPLVVPRTAGR